MGLWKTRIYTCKNQDCRIRVEVTPEDVLICNVCGTPLISGNGSKPFYIGLNPMARTTKMEFSSQTYNESYKDFRK